MAKLMRYKAPQLEDFPTRTTYEEERTKYLWDPKRLDAALEA